MTTELTTTTIRPPATTRPAGRGIGKALAQSEERYLAALGYRPISIELQRELAQFADRSSYQSKLRTWREARELLADLPDAAALVDWSDALEKALAAQPDRAPTRGMIAMLLDAFPSGRPANLDAYADTLLHDALALGHTPYEVALACRDLRRDKARVFLPSVGEWVAALEAARETWRRAAGTLAAYVGALCAHDHYLAPGERAVIPILAASVTQAGRAFMHAKGILEHSPVLSGQIEGEPTADTIRLATRLDIEVKPANFRTVRSITAAAAVCDEVAFWMIEASANPDAEILNALRPALATTEGPLMVISSPHAKRGELYRAYRRDYGPKGDPRILVAKGPSRTFNSTLEQRVVDRAYARDPAAASAEYGGEFRSDIEAYISREAVEACTSPGVRERPYVTGIAYHAFVDPSGGSADAMTLAITHLEGVDVVLDVVRERKPPFAPEGVVEEFCATLKGYGLATVTGDRYGGEWPREQFRKRGVAYELSDLPRSELYRNLLPVLNSGSAQLLDLPIIADELSALERRTARGGRESIDHPPNGHDDVANAVAGAAWLARPQARQGFVWNVNGLEIDHEGNVLNKIGPSNSIMEPFL